MTTAVNIETASTRCFECGRWYWYETFGVGTLRKCTRRVEARTQSKGLNMSKASDRIEARLKLQHAVDAARTEHKRAGAYLSAKEWGAAEKAALELAQKCRELAHAGDPKLRDLAAAAKAALGLASGEPSK